MLKRSWDFSSNPQKYLDVLICNGNHMDLTCSTRFTPTYSFRVNLRYLQFLAAIKHLRFLRYRNIVSTNDSGCINSNFVEVYG